MKHRAPEPTCKAERPDFASTPLVQLIASIAPSLKSPVVCNNMAHSVFETNDEIAEGEPCKNGGCKEVRTILQYRISINLR